EFTENSDTLALDLSSAYAVPSLKKLERTFRFKRGDAPSLTVIDEVELTKPESFATALVTWGKWQRISPTEILFTEATGAVRVKIDTGGVPFDIHTKQLQADVPTATKAMRLGIALNGPIQHARVTLTITPEALSTDSKATKP
ncbi:MAG: Heparinase II/III-like protein, partial [Verrucomicrobiales bacterium]|nr:Heparinase II/III-like protein [Verrucomicrobiales bacterium]